METIVQNMSQKSGADFDTLAATRLRIMASVMPKKAESDDNHYRATLLSLSSAIRYPGCYVCHRTLSSRVGSMAAMQELTPTRPAKSGGRLISEAAHQQ
jgi:hypothetical protein